MFCLELFRKTTNITDSKPLVLSFGLFFFGIALFPKNYAISSFLERFIYPYLNIGIEYVLSGILLFLANIKFKQLKMRGDNNS